MVDKMSLLLMKKSGLTVCVTRWWRETGLETENRHSSEQSSKNAHGPSRPALSAPAGSAGVHAVLGRLAGWATITFCRDIIITPAGITKILACFVRDENNFI